MDVVLLSRWQFAITTIYHFFFVPVTLGLSIFTALLETCYVTTKREKWKRTCRQLTKFFGTLFLINFSMGVVTGIVQEFHFGMNWSEYARFMGDIFGAPLALEALTAFFLESTFLGIWMFGWDRLSEKLHCACIWIVAFGSNLSAFWILVANSFMQHPVGYAINNGRAEMTDFTALITNPYVLGEYPHALFAGVATGGFVVIAVSAWKLVHDEASREAFSQAIKGGALFMLVGILGTMGSGHMHAQYMVQANPMKLSSMEALWETEDPAPFAVVADINEKEHHNDFEITIPGMFSFMLYNKPSGEVKGINDLQAMSVEKYGPGDYIPDVAGLFWSFRIMVGTGGLMMAIAALTFLLAWKKRIMDFPCMLKLLPALLPIAYLANSAGWYVAEGGRQPWIVVGLQKTADAVSPSIASAEVGITVIGFTLIYLILAMAALYAACHFICTTSITASEGSDA
ncbi:MAG: cytochrome ubiquinol oxidase subunit I [Selenomonadaceae bacterium]|nr:cytochrome ubiquinol oxidase subunit I [Selenomonadaceae bacterium]MBQ1509679.1 cytochrome ubiquinol oxidase subunit I [Selenomonadaceae bacterium]MBQ1914711.1 cytochrome ubiquinol oxidase subunit I [Selenomonadaceae bacterium]MBQ3970720.1 cytochrome ubiquinol oxidase subunit I [Selenomonadaceae bacterium]